MRSILALVLVASLTGCAFGDGRGNDAGPPGAVDSGPDVTDAGPPPSTDAGPPPGADAGPDSADAGPRDAGAIDSGPGAADAGPMGGALDPGLSLPDPSGTPCSTPGSMGECPGIEVCRFFSTTEGRCESCGACGNLGASCSASADCDILFMCFEGRCTNFCTLGSFECGPVADCLDVGHPTRGVCRP